MTVEIVSGDIAVDIFVNQPKPRKVEENIYDLINQAAVIDDTIIDFGPVVSDEIVEPQLLPQTPDGFSNIITGLDQIQLTAKTERDNPDVIILRPAESELTGLSNEAKVFLQLDTTNYRKPFLVIERVETGIVNASMRRKGRKVGFQVNKVEKLITTTSYVLNDDLWIETEISLPNTGLNDLAEILEIGKSLAMTK